MYQEIKPSKRLDDLIDSFWTFSKIQASLDDVVFLQSKILTAE
jgi:hypothetical protein